MRGPLAVEPVRPETAGIAFELMREFVASIGKAHEFTITEAEFSRGLFRDSPSFEVVVARFEGDIVGYATFRTTFDTWSGGDNMHVSAIYVRPAFRARYIAAALYLYLATLARNRGYRSIVGLVPRSNEGLLGVYRSAGAGFTDYVMCELKLGQISDDILSLALPRPAQPAQGNPA